MNLLTVDLGNSRCKLRLWSSAGERGPRPIAHVDFDTALGIGAKAAAWLAREPRADAGALCSVADEDLEAEVAGALRGSVAGCFDARPEPGLSIACREPATIGRDRLFAARAALELAGGSAIVVDAGTALTVDAVRADKTFLGGAIAPGPDLLSLALAEGTARLPRVEPRPRANALGRDTREALLAGVAVGFRGAARELAERVAEEAGLRGAPIVLTGGARAFLLDPPVFTGAQTIEECDLVHLGLLAALRESLSPAQRSP
jgi:type III pantothenate kinase